MIYATVTPYPEPLAGQRIRARIAAAFAINTLGWIVAGAVLASFGAAGSRGRAWRGWVLSSGALVLGGVLTEGYIDVRGCLSRRERTQAALSLVSYVFGLIVVLALFGLLLTAPED